MRGTTVLPGTPCAAPSAGEPPLHRLELPGPGAAPFAAGSFEEMGPLSRTGDPHRHTFYEIVHVTAGSGAHVVDFARWPVRPPHLAVILPGQIHHWQGGRQLDGTLALFTEDFLLDHPGDRALLRRLGRTCWFALDPEEHEAIGRLMTDLAAEHRQRAAGHESVLRALLHVLVVRAARMLGQGGAGGPAPVGGPTRAAGWRRGARMGAGEGEDRESAAQGESGPGRKPGPGRESERKPESGPGQEPGRKRESGPGREPERRRKSGPGRGPGQSRDPEPKRDTAKRRVPGAGQGSAPNPAPAPARPPALAEAFARLTAHGEAVAWSVRECAGRLGVSPGHLGQAVRAATGRSPGRLLIEARVYQAQRLLAHTDLPVRQVAARTGFTDPAYFCRFFRRETGTSPGDFRKHHRHHHQSIAATGTRA